MHRESDQFDLFSYHDAWLEALHWETGDLILTLTRVTWAGVERPVLPRLTLRLIDARLTGMTTWSVSVYDAQRRVIEEYPLAPVPEEEWMSRLQGVSGAAHIFGLSREGECISLDVTGEDAFTVDMTCRAVHLSWEETLPPYGLRWLFFDVGSTLVDETEAYDHRIRDMIAGTEVTYAQFQQKRFEFARQNKRGDLEAAAFFGLTKTPWRHEDERPYPDAEPVLRTLRARGYRIGVIANQSAGTEARLRAWGLLAHIDLVVSSAEEGVSKPDPAIFRIALARAGCQMQEAAMIGDRLDNDVSPAKALGMFTVWLPQGPALHHSPRNDAETPHVRVSSLSELLGLFTMDEGGTAL